MSQLSWWHQYMCELLGWVGCEPESWPPSAGWPLTAVAAMAAGLAVCAGAITKCICGCVTLAIPRYWVELTGWSAVAVLPSIQFTDDPALKVSVAVVAIHPSGASPAGSPDQSLPTGSLTGLSVAVHFSEEPTPIKWRRQSSRTGLLAHGSSRPYGGRPNWAVSLISRRPVPGGPVTCLNILGSLKSWSRWTSRTSLLASGSFLPSGDKPSRAHGRPVVPGRTGPSWTCIHGRLAPIGLDPAESLCSTVTPPLGGEQDQVGVLSTIDQFPEEPAPAGRPSVCAEGPW